METQVCSIFLSIRNQKKHAPR